MNPTIAQMVIKSNQRDIEAAAAQSYLAATAKAASRPSPTSAPTGTRRLVTSLAFHLAAVVR